MKKMIELCLLLYRHLIKTYRNMKVNDFILFIDLFVILQIFGGSISEHIELVVNTPCERYALLPALVTHTFCSSTGHKSSVVHQMDGKLGMVSSIY